MNREKAHLVVAAASQAARAVVRDSTTYAWIPRGDSWSHGGCGVFARAMMRVFGGKLWVVSTKANPIEHYVVRLGDYFIDSDGAQTREQLLQKMSEYEYLTGHWLRAYRSELNNGEILCPRESVNKLATYIMELETRNALRP